MWINRLMIPVLGSSYEFFTYHSLQESIIHSFIRLFASSFLFQIHESHSLISKFFFGSSMTKTFLI